MFSFYFIVPDSFNGRTESGTCWPRVWRSKHCAEPHKYT